MTGPLQRRAIADGVWFSRIHDPKFYHNSISVTIITPLAEGKTSAAVLAAYLRKTFPELTVSKSASHREVIQYYTET